MKRCVSCKEYGLGEKCNDCGNILEVVAPLKYSPEDPQGNRRRKRLDAGSKDWIESLPNTNIDEDLKDE